MSQDNEKIYSLQEAAGKLGIDTAVVDRWVAQKLIVPTVNTADSGPMFDDAGLQVLEQFKQLVDMGYSDQDLKKIQRKIGIPSLKKRTDKGHGKYLTVGELADRSGINPRTIKYWEERGIIEPTTRSEGGFRLYDPYYVLLCNLIQDLQNFGFTLDEIRDVADLFRTFYDISTHAYQGSNEQALEQLDIMLAEIKTFNARMDNLNKGIDRWRKLLKEKRSEILSNRKRLTKGMDRAAQTKQGARAKS